MRIFTPNSPRFQLVTQLSSKTVQRLKDEVYLEQIFLQGADRESCFPYACVVFSNDGLVEDEESLKVVGSNSAFDFDQVWL